MSLPAIKVLERIVLLKEEADSGEAAPTEKKKKRENRLLEFLKPVDDVGQQGWFFYVPIHFNEALDIKQTTRQKDLVQYSIWTQGGWFYFKSGDIIYDSPDAYKDWGLNGMQFGYCLQVNSASGAIPATQKTKRNSGVVNFSLFKTDKKSRFSDQKNNYSLTQDEFVRFLIIGQSSVINLEKRIK
jgi:hypothetical protein